MPSSSVGLKNEGNRVDWVVKKLLEIPAGKRILDAGSGQQPFRSFCSHLTYVSQDFGGYDPSAYSSGLQVSDWAYGKTDHICDICTIPESDETFDVILCTEVFEHIVDPIAAIREFSRLLKPGGKLIVTAPFCSLSHFAPHHYYSGFSRFFYERVLADNGFEILELDSNGNYFEYIAQELRRLKSVAGQYSPDIEIGSQEIRSINKLVAFLAKLSNSDSKSRELLCFGFHVVAQRR